METITEARRPYRMGARAQAAAATGERILDATEELFWARPLEQIALDEVATRADVTVQTVLRRYGSKQGLIEAVAARGLETIRRQRDEAPVGDVAAAVRNLLDHYETMGERVLRLLAEEHTSETMGSIVERGRSLHVAWVRRTFAPQIADCRGAARTRRLAQFVAVTDVYTWKLLRTDSGLSRPQTERALTELIAGLGGK